MFKNFLELMGVVSLVFVNILGFGFLGPALISANDYVAVSLGFLGLILIVVLDYKVIKQLISTHFKL